MVDMFNSHVLPDQQAFGLSEVRRTREGRVVARGKTIVVKTVMSKIIRICCVERMKGIERVCRICWMTKIRNVSSRICRKIKLIRGRSSCSSMRNTRVVSKIRYPRTFKNFLKLFCIKASRGFQPSSFSLISVNQKVNGIHFGRFLTNPPKGYFPDYQCNGDHQNKIPRGIIEIFNGKKTHFKSDQSAITRRDKSDPKQSQKKVKDPLFKRRFLPSCFCFLRHVNLPYFFISLVCFFLYSKPKKRVCYAF